jgi:hypothetical protein
MYNKCVHSLKIMFKYILIACLIFFSGCKSKNDFTPIFNVPDQFSPYVDSFIVAAAERGINITIDNLIITYDSSLSIAYCANSNVTSSQNNVQKIIYLNPNIQCWQNSRQLETLLFHEMGHCILGREHDFSLLPNGDPKSIMFPDYVTLYSPCAYPINDSCNQLYKREYYLDELFNPNTPVPDWAK